MAAPRSIERFHFLVDGISRSSSGSVTVVRAVCGPGVNTKPSEGSERFRMFGSAVRFRNSALGGLKRTLAPALREDRLEDAAVVDAVPGVEGDVRRARRAA